MSEKERYSILLKKSMAYCAGKECCRSEMTRKLASWDADEKETEKIMQQLIIDKFIDEERYARAFVKDKFRHNKWGRLKITAALRQKNLSHSTILQAFDSIDDTEYLETLRNIISGHRRSVRAKNQYALKGKLLRYGLSKGFESHLLYDILNDTGD